MIIENGNLNRQTLLGKIALVTGAGGGIGYEAARSLLWLGCKVVLAEINPKIGRQAEHKLMQEFGIGGVRFIQTNVGDEGSIKNLAHRVGKIYGQVDIVINNATLAPLGAVQDVNIKVWDSSYHVNLRGPVLLARAFIPGMVARDWGVFVCVSSTGGSYMGAYETLKAAQVHLGTTLNLELENTQVSAFTIGPGFVPTPTATASIPKLASMLGKTSEEMQEVLEPVTLSIEAAGAGFAAAVALAPRYRGQEISSMQALIDAGISLAEPEKAVSDHYLNAQQYEQALSVCRLVHSTLAEQSAGWKGRSIFEQQWLIRTFKQKAALPVDEWLSGLERLERALQIQDSTALSELNLPLDRLASYYEHIFQMAKGYVRDPIQRDEQLRIVKGWQKEVEDLHELLTARQ